MLRWLTAESSGYIGSETQLRCSMNGLLRLLCGHKFQTNLTLLRWVCSFFFFFFFFFFDVDPKQQMRIQGWVSQRSSASEENRSCVRDGFKTQPPVDRRFRPVPPGFYCSKQWQPPRTGRNRRSTGGWVLKPPLSLFNSISISWACCLHWVIDTYQIWLFPRSFSWMM